MLIPSFIVSTATFPGVILRAAAQKTFCSLVGARVDEVCYFRVSSPSSYVTYEPPTSVWRHMVVGFGPMVLQSLIAFVIGYLMLARGPSPVPALLWFALIWVAVSVATHAFPATEDARGIWKSLHEGDRATTAAKVVGAPLVGLAYIGAYGSVLWIDLIYGLAVAVALPMWVSFQ